MKGGGGGGGGAVFYFCTEYLCIRNVLFANWGTDIMNVFVTIIVIARKSLGSAYLGAIITKKKVSLRCRYRVCFERTIDRCVDVGCLVRQCGGVPRDRVKVKSRFGLAVR